MLLRAAGRRLEVAIRTSETASPLSAGSKFIEDARRCLQTLPKVLTGSKIVHLAGSGKLSLQMQAKKTLRCMFYQMSTQGTGRWSNQENRLDISWAVFHLWPHSSGHLLGEVPTSPPLDDDGKRDHCFLQGWTDSTRPTSYKIPTAIVA